MAWLGCFNVRCVRHLSSNQWEQSDNDGMMTRWQQWLMKRFYYKNMTRAHKHSGRMKGKKYEAHKSHAGHPIASSSSIDLQSTVLVEITVLVAAINMDEIYKKNYQWYRWFWFVMCLCSTSNQQHQHRILFWWRRRNKRVPHFLYRV